MAKGSSNSIAQGTSFASSRGSAPRPRAVQAPPTRNGWAQLATDVVALVATVAATTGSSEAIIPSATALDNGPFKGAIIDQNGSTIRFTEKGQSSDDA